MKKIKQKTLHFISYVLLCVVTGIIKFLPYNVTKLLGKLFGDLIRLASKKRYNIAFNNLKMAFPDFSDDKINNIAVKSFRNFGTTFVELFCMGRWSEQFIKSRVKFHNQEEVIAEHKKGKGIIFLSGHFGNWELLAYSAYLYLGFNFDIIVKALKNRFVDRMTNKIRTSRNNTVTDMNYAARKMVKTLKSGGVISLLVDQSAQEGKDVFVDFFGIPSLTYKAPAELSLKFGIPIFMGFCMKDDDGICNVYLQKVPFDDLTYCREDVITLTQRHTKILENAIRQKPELWSWMHRRWKHSPINL